MKTRHNSFRLVHKGLRAMLYATSLKIQQADLSSVNEGAPLVDELQLLVSLFETHAHSENTFYNEPLEKLKPEVATLFEQEHEEDHRLGNKLLSIIAKWKVAADEQSRLMAGQELFYAFNEYIAFNLYHMNKEEIMLNEAMWSVYSDEQIVGIEQQVVQHISPADMGEYGKWILRGNDNRDIAHWISGIKNGAPAEVYNWIQGLAKQELSANRFTAVMSLIS